MKDADPSFVGLSMSAFSYGVFKSKYCMHLLDVRSAAFAVQPRPTLKSSYREQTSVGILKGRGYSYRDIYHDS